ncbi:siderophore-interacting protein [Corynebacterium uberis]|uniref:siderophore-interacting protein n=1 Tax=Corynebacterium TaxID=1716 RepID=UPI001D0B55C1|nr:MULTISPECIES: siderophore-interacting protein [Corynebacterium]MCZ9309286.1 siderophore-interacting protein [Corynebacterium sp. c6VSa_13]UDL72839.1 siderophore-interacting protein [Corynebacterium uberis]UDL76283.1 siderophore-interacting protein [Corynebacterium uberis]UDL78496.1 siderophore-interacting protein [Corynebacterium uberis]UDL80777.1 siderophore-interacting protein [Corynebacterium uberis]
MSTSPASRRPSEASVAASPVPPEPVPPVPPEPSPAPYAITPMIVESAEQISPHFMRVVFADPHSAIIGDDCPRDRRIKIVIPDPTTGALPALSDGPDWYQEWLAIPDGQRGIMRTYSVRALEHLPHATRMTVDFVLHCVPGATGPAAAWAAQARPGQRVIIAGPRRGYADLGGIEFLPPDHATSWIMLGDETAAPAIARTAEDLNDTRLRAYIEIPTAEDALLIDAPRPTVSWLPRGKHDRGVVLHNALDDLLASDPDALGPQTYVWISAESGVVRALKRRLDDRPKDMLTFMGYWRRGVAMRS